MTENENNNNYLIILIIFNCLVYGLCCLLILKRKSYTCISIRSPTLLLITNVSNFFMTIILILCKLFNTNFISLFYYVFQITMIASILLRYERIISCLKINIQKFYKKRRLLQEKFFVRILIIIFAAILILLIIIDVLGNNYFELFSFLDKNEKTKLKSNIKIWIIWNFVEQLVLITYIFRIYKQKLKYILSLELYLFFIIWFIYSNYSSLIYIRHKNINELNNNSIDFAIISLIFLYLCLILNALVPILMSFYSKLINSYYFTPKLTNNFYLFLTNEECYKSFNEYLISKNKIGSFYLKIYTHIMKFKLDLTLNLNKLQGLNEANNIFNTYFNTEKYSEQIDNEILVRVRDKCEILKLNNFNKDIFDDGLQYAYNELNKIFFEYRSTVEFKELLEELNLYSFIQCKMCNTGLINKF